MRQAQAQRRQAVLLDAGHLAEGARVPVGQERRIVTEAGGAARRPHQRAVGARLDLFEMIVRPGDAQRGNEMRLALRRRGGAALLQQALDPRHRGGKILGRPGPARRENPGRAIERVDHQSGIVGEGRQLRGLRRRHRLDPRIGAKGVAGLVGLAEAEFAGRDRLDAVRRQQFAHLGELAGIVGRDHELAGDSTMLSHALIIRHGRACSLSCAGSRGCPQGRA